MSERVYIMGILNVTPDSFSDGGRFFDTRKAVEQALAMIRDGADIIDVGGESTRPGAQDVSEAEELGRVIPVITALSAASGAVISIDTRKAGVADEAIKAGAAIVNDVSALTGDPAMAGIVARRGAALIAMHMKGSPQDMQADPRYGDVVAEISAFLKAAVDRAKAAGIREDAVIVDPGIGFGKTFDHNLEILNRLDELGALGRPVCVGTSRKAFIGHALGINDTDERLAGTIASCVIAVMKGARVLRVHDVKEVRQAVRMAERIMKVR